MAMYHLILKKKGLAYSENKLVVKVESEFIDKIPKYLKNRRREIQTLQEALEKKDFETIKGIGHKLKGHAGCYGFDLLGEFGMAVELAAKAEKAQSIQEIIQEIESYLDRLKVVFK